MRTYSKRPLDKPLMKRVGSTLRKQRLELGLGIKVFSSMTGLGVGTISEAERGLRDLRVMEFNKMLEALNLKVEDVI